MRKEKKLKLLEGAISDRGYRVRYEKGSFIGGDCRLRDHNIVVINKFLPLEGKIYTIAKVLSRLEPGELPAEVQQIIDEFGFSSIGQLPLIDTESQR
ncbi:hypothetical protein INT08_03705 [Prosthecochloris sp. N3]|uniref:Uncharacterized protein n=1 Tax=Prosthecochloris ethylica TaxID=2743976 RepID=A0ABR9XQX4_9CHLB|nr:hypothetical protein [Prosthecochloris ethylica]MBF0585501.1 hypothetical protein [Prosthecochloris ethylica]MBF0636287.1 hypothetical protein [Prosthecochloris ethylica]NUK46731.1 hypothetical protein [Prosthecochloris ethylica]